ncbi:lysosomal amino acid transporter 1 homolog [Bombina bombina]|uniref:lysosomal amino acid transporter 1 homolog n=1 Tax=Bombina bombina TaxID=8345 RepID=UPI00235A6DAD|nr:lysosomal amino acid transporter 1 homolog [Bombina bombina]
MATVGCKPHDLGHVMKWIGSAKRKKASHNIRKRDMREPANSRAEGARIRASLYTVGILVLIIKFLRLSPNSSQWIWNVFSECANEGRDVASWFLGLGSHPFLYSCFLPLYPDQSVRRRQPTYEHCISHFLTVIRSYISKKDFDLCVILYSRIQRALQNTSMDGVKSNWRLGSLSLSSNFSDCPPNSSQWIWNVLAKCANEGRDCFYICNKKVLYLISTHSLISPLRQYYRFCKTGNMDEAISFWFLMGLLAGDSCNLLGAFLSHQLPLQVQLPTTPSLQCDKLAGICPFTTQDIIRFVIGSISSVMFLCSRVPQIITNFKRRSTEGLALSLFCLVVLGNLMYGLGILLKKPDNGQSESNYLLHHLPWLVSSLGVMNLDVIIIFQFIVYHKKSLDSLDETTPILGLQRSPIYT